jgi:hypothetical protein
VCPFCFQETKASSAEELWISLVKVAGLERWITEGWEDDDGQTIKPDATAYESAKAVLLEYWALQQKNPMLSFMLPSVTLDILNRGMFIDFRADKKVVCCYCNQKGEYTVSHRSEVEQTLKSPAEAASLLDKWVREYL